MKDQKTYERTQKKKPRRLRFKRPKLRIAGVTTEKKERRVRKTNEYILSLEAENRELKRKLIEALKRCKTKKKRT